MHTDLHGVTDVCFTVTHLGMACNGQILLQPCWRAGLKNIAAQSVCGLNGY